MLRLEALREDLIFNESMGAALLRLNFGWLLQVIDNHMKSITICTYNIRLAM
ncbi:hypothetical protein O166_06400 [Pseudogulbenkiania ferrooxidans EGD-HP2]|uniref:Uncharacterized protein n=1 Tax=Pseudogulbenkiania ferrooxidans EGD-HP2 TaxID=1388764 RepID=A0ABN0N7H6_9NEIS|nr:hypothetical protein O166_06400 [Pseudogulbenkiania ferrooxidans EGD-HP2]